MKKPVTLDKIKYDLASFKSSKLNSAVEFNTDNILLGCSYNPDTNYLDLLSLEKKDEKIKQVLYLSNSYENRYDIFASIDSNNIDKQSNFLDYLYSNFGLSIIKDNKTTIDMYLDLVQVIDKKGYVNIDECKKLLNLELKMPPEEVDLSQVYKHGYFKSYTEGNYTIMTYNDIVVDVDLSLTQKLNSDYSIFLSMTNDYIYSEDNKIKLFLVDRGEIDNILNSSSTFTSSLSISPNYDKEKSGNVKEDFYNLYKYMFKSIYKDL